MAKYKIVKKVGFDTSLSWYYIYKKRWLFGWKRIGFEATQQKAEEVIASLKRTAEARRKKPELIGYY